MRRGREDRLAGGVAAGVAARTGFDVTVVRTVFVLASLLGGFGAAAYVLAWLLVPADGGDSNIAREALTDRRGIALAAGLGSLLVVVLLIASALGAAWLGNLAWPLVISAAGIVLIWRNAPADEQALMRRLAEPLPGLTDGNRRSGTVLRLSFAALLLAGGLIALLSGNESIALLRPLGGVALVIARTARLAVRRPGARLDRSPGHDFRRGGAAHPAGGGGSAPGGRRGGDRRRLRARR